MRRSRELRWLGHRVWRSACGGFALFSLLAMAGPGRLNAQEEKASTKPQKDFFDLSLEDIKKLSVSGAAKHEQPISDAPSSVTVLTADEIKKSGYRTLADALRSVPGFYVSYDRNRSFLGVRGFNRDDFNSRILLLVDGHRVNNNLSDSAFLGTDFILDLDLIDKIEVIRGPGSVLYGSNAFFGVINIQTRRGQDLRTGEISAEYGSFDSYQGRATYGTIFESGLELLLSGSLYDSAGPERLYYREFDSPLTNHGIARRRDDDDFKQVFGSVRFKDFTLQGAYSMRDKGDPTAPFGSAFDTSRTRNKDERTYVDLKFDHQFPDDLNFLARVYYDRYDLRGDLFYTGPQLIRDLQVGEWWGTEGQVRKKLFERHTFTFGAEYRGDFRQHRRGFNNGVLFAEQRRSRDSYGFYLQNEIALITNLTLNAGARYDWYSTFGETYNPRLALIANPWKPATFKAIGGTAFRGPDFFETVFNSALRPETITTYELAYEQKYGQHWRSTVSLFYNEISDLISFRNNTYENIEGADAKGVELALDGTWAHGLATRLSYSYQETEDSETHAVLTDSPRHLAKANVTVPVFKENIFANLEAEFTSSRVTLFGTRASGFGLLNFTLFSRELLKGLEVSGSVYNLLDKRYSDPATPFHLQDLIEQNGRTFRVKVTYRF